MKGEKKRWKVPRDEMDENLDNRGGQGTAAQGSCLARKGRRRGSASRVLVFQGRGGGGGGGGDAEIVNIAAVDIMSVGWLMTSNTAGENTIHALVYQCEKKNVNK